MAVLRAEAVVEGAGLRYLSEAGDWRDMAIKTDRQHRRAWVEAAEGEVVEA